jgi:toxin YoeB
MSYTVIIKDNAARDIAAHKKSGNMVLCHKIQSLIQELKEHPDTGTGKPERLKGNLAGFWSRRINQEHRLVYSIEKNIVTVTVFSAKGHY